MLWKHPMPTPGEPRPAESAVLVSSVVTADNYEYAFYWYFYRTAPSNSRPSSPVFAHRPARHGQEAWNGTQVATASSPPTTSTSSPSGWT